MKLFIFPLLVSLTALFAFANKTPGTLSGNANDIYFTGKPAGIPVDTPRIKHFARVEVKKTTGKVKGMLLDDVMVYIINGKKYFDVELDHFKHATIKADEMIITPINDANAKKLYGGISMKGVIEFKNAKLIPPMVNLTKNKPLFILDGEEQENVQKVKSLDPVTIAQIAVLKDEMAVLRYGSKAKYGVVDIRTYSGSLVVINQDDMEAGKVPPPDDVLAQLPDLKVEEDPNKVYERVEIDADFKGGNKALMRYLDSNLKKNIPLDNAAPKGRYVVTVQMIVDKDGSISDVRALTNHGFGMEEEAVRVLKKTNKMWTPAVQNGRPVKAYKKQPVTFEVE